jgi:Leucine-rich repeat (LRR) protein
VLKGIEEDLAMLKLNTCRGECAGTLDLTKTLEENGLTKEMVSQHVHATHFPVVSKAILQQNKLTVVPREISLVTTLTTLDLSRNYLSSKIFEQRVTLDNLINLDLSINKFDSLDLLPTIFSAPSLKILDVSFNSLTSLIPLHTHYPNLSTLHANSNQLESITPNDFEGLEVVQVNNNSINRLPPELALVTSLRVLGVDGNTFRVPGRRIVEAGSAALLEWLRGRCVEA